MYKRITVFGGSKPIPGERAYEEAYQLGFSLAKAGCDVITGGYVGTMEAVSRGAAEAGGHVIGVTCEEIERWRPIGPNQWVKEEWRCVSLNERIQRLISGGDAAIALPGGVGTLAEIILMWNQLIVEAISPKPIITIGKGWKQVLDSLMESQNEYIPTKDRRLIQFVDDIQSAVREISR